MMVVDGLFTLGLLTAGLQTSAADMDDIASHSMHRLADKKERHDWLTLRTAVTAGREVCFQPASVLQ